MGKKSAPKAPKPPKPGDVLGDTAKYNRFSTSTPFGSTSWHGTPGSPDYGTSVDLSPEMKGVAGNIFGSAGQAPGFTPSAPRELPSPVSQLPQYSAGDPKYRALEDAIYNDQAMQFEPQFAAQSRGFENSMANRGQPAGGEAYDTGYANMSDSQNRARIMAANQATMAGRGAFEQDRGFANQVNQQDFSNREQMTGADRGYDLSRYGVDLGADQQRYGQLAQLLGLTPQDPTGGPLDVGGAYGMQQQGQLAKYQGKLGSYTSMWSGLGSLLGQGARAYGSSSLPGGGGAK